MSDRATHIIRFSNGEFTIAPSVVIFSDALTSASISFPQLLHLKCFVGSFLPRCLHTFASLACISRVNNHNRNAIEQSFIFKRSEVVQKDHFYSSFVLNFVSTFRSEPNVGQILDSNTFTTFFSRNDNRFCDSVINNLEWVLFFALKPFRQLPAIPFCGTLKVSAFAWIELRTFCRCSRYLLSPSAECLTPSEVTQISVKPKSHPRRLLCLRHLLREHQRFGKDKTYLSCKPSQLLL